MIIVILWCLTATPVAQCTPKTAIAVVTRPANQLECAMPWQAQADANPGLYVVTSCSTS